jgi:ribosomal-protein-alanine N-acetyltransferase
MTSVVTVSLRRAVPADAAALARIHAASFDDGWTEEDMAGWLGRPEAFAWLAEDCGCEAVAFGLALTAGDDAEILTIATIPALRGAGIGRQILAELDKEAARRGLSRFVLEVARNNLPALGLYRSYGFVEIGVRTNYYRTQAGLVDALVHERPVGPANGGQTTA